MAVMFKLTRSQILQSLIASLLALTPLLSSASLRSTYIYFIINLLIIALSAEAGLLSLLVSNPNPNNLEAEVLDVITKDDSDTNSSNSINSTSHKMKAIRAVEKCNYEKLGTQVMNKSVNQVKKCPSTTSIFFISGAGESRQLQDEDQDRHHQVRLEIIDNNMELDEEELDVVVGGQQDQLFAKAENFIGNFYKQLKMQREESWNKINGFYLKFTEGSQ